MTCLVCVVLVYACVLVCVFISVYVYVCVYVCLCMCVCMRAHTRAWVHVCVYVCACVSVCCVWEGDMTAIYKQTIVDANTTRVHTYNLLHTRVVRP